MMLLNLTTGAIGYFVGNALHPDYIIVSVLPDGTGKRTWARNNTQVVA